MCVWACACVFNSDPMVTDMQVVLGGVDLKKHETADQTLDVEQYIVHENFTQTNEALYNDIGQLLTHTASTYH